MWFLQITNFEREDNELNLKGHRGTIRASKAFMLLVPNIINWGTTVLLEATESRIPGRFC